MAEIFVSPIISKLVESLASVSLSYLSGYEGKLNDWRRMFLAIEAVLADAEERQITDKFVQQWLHDLQLLAYAIEDLVDDLAVEGSSRRQMMVQPRSKLRNLVNCCIIPSITPAALSFNHAMNSKISTITSRLQDLSNKKNDLNLRELVGGRSSITGDWRLQSTSVVDQALVYGREEDRSALLTMLLKETPSGHDDKMYCVISIVGMGGIGKTTLAQSLYNTDQVKDCFDLRAWVSVSDDFDVLKLSKIIYEEVSDVSCEFMDLNEVQVKLQERLSNKKFLLVLDDVWNEDYAKWDLLCAPFRFGAPGSRIIVTTRSHKITQTMGSMVARDLKELSDGDCLSLLAQHALQRPNFDGRPDLKEIGEVIAKKCKGLPLAAKSLGGLLRTKESSKQWIEVSKSKIWELPPESNVIIPALRLSYHHLPLHLKPLFVYCSLFPKDYELDKQELILLWMAQGFLKQSREQKHMEELGSEYFSELLSRSFFQHSGRDKSRFVMHDLMNELAQFVAGVICSHLDDKMESNEQYKVSEESRHASFISHRYGDFKKLKALNAAQCLRTLLPIHEHSWGEYYLSSMALKDFPSLPRLRVLSFRRYCITELPESIGDLKHMRYLDLSMTAITKLPESICGLYNLQTLLLHGCHKLDQLPTCILSLIGLRHLDIVDTPRLNQMPLGIGMLTHLRTLSKIIIDNSSQLKITELKGLPHLQGTLSIFGMENVINVQDAIDANLFGKKDLDRLEMKWSSSFGSTREEELEFKVLDVLKPQIGLGSLQIEFYGGQKFPSWIGDHSFCNMVNLTLSGCKNCVYLPSLGKLSSLKNLVIEGMGGVKTVGMEFFGAFGAGSPHLVAFQSLENLTFEDMDGLEEWSVDLCNGKENVIQVFPCLLKIKLSGCLKLGKVSLPKIPSLEELTISSCSNEVLRSMVGVSLIKKLELSDISGLTQLDEEIIRFLEAVEEIRIEKCDALRYLWQEKVACQVLVKIKMLWVKSCEQLVSLGDEEQLLPHNLESLELSYCDNLEKMPNWKNNILSLRQLRIDNCKKLKNMSSTAADLQPNIEKQKCIDMAKSSGGKHGDGFSNLESVFIDGCPCLTSFPTGKKLRSLYVSGCENLEELEEVGLMFSLESIYFLICSNLKSLPDEGFAHLTKLWIFGCDGIESIPERSLSPTLKTLGIRFCKNLKYFQCGLTSLRELTIEGCKNLESYPSRGCWPPNIISLEKGDVKQPIKEWGLETLPTSLRSLHVSGRGDFPQLDFPQLPCTSLTNLAISSFQKLESLYKDLENLSSLEHLTILYCPKLRLLPADTLLHKLSSLTIDECPLLKKRCEKKKGDYWPSISHIPHVEIDSKDM